MFTLLSSPCLAFSFSYLWVHERDFCSRRLVDELF